ncbi:hypothetical protein B0H66DRAFT_558091 [Apodospora peruviana]|uniref:Uncharacterized protein n=1 Tax=Apodospora peruviana TaxID=516989 RepID=A0AAE0I6V6_9PEZI|nr:hypothetical protein B0H66DRAFT_558091 [Apodospora peruviana]
MIVKLTEPMTLIAQKIQTSISVNNEQIKTLSDTRLTREDVLRNLYVQRESL